MQHAAIASNLAARHPGERTYNYVCEFLSNRTVELSLAGGLTSARMNLGDRGTPQGAVLSPFLFNLVMSTLPASLDEIPGLRHAIHADDITLWTATGSDGQIEETLQRAAHAVVHHATQAGLNCSESKSELLLLRPRSRPSQDQTPPFTDHPSLRKWHDLTASEPHANPRSSRPNNPIQHHHARRADRCGHTDGRSHRRVSSHACLPAGKACAKRNLSNSFTPS